MKTPILLLLSFISLLLLSGCRSNDPGATDSLECVSGVIVGDKCGVFALKLDKRHTLPGKTWPKPVDKEGQRVLQDIDNVIGLSNLPVNLQKDGIRVFVRLRKATDEERVIPCYTDMPPPPAPVYIVLAADDSGCPGDPDL